MDEFGVRESSQKSRAAQLWHTCRPRRGALRGGARRFIAGGILVATVGQPSLALARQDSASSGGVPIAVWELAPDDSTVLDGYSSDVEFSLDLPIGWTIVGGAQFSAEMRASDEIRNDAAVRFDLDGQPASVWTPGAASDVEFVVPGSAFEDGDVSVVAASTSPLREDNICPDDSHVSRWVDIAVPRVSASITTAELDVARAIAGMGPISSITREPISIVAPNAASPATLETIGAVVASISHHGVPHSWTVVAEPNLASPGAQIRIIEETGVTARIDVIVEDERPIVTMTGDPAQILGLVRATADPERLLFFHDVAVDASQIPREVTNDPSEVFTFADAGYDDRTLRGFGRQALIYRIHLPAGVPPDVATLGLFGTHSPALAAHEATVTVQINGSDSEITAVADVDGELDVLHTVTPADLRPGLNYVKIETELGSGTGSQCPSSEPGSVPNWLTISRMSAVGVDRTAAMQPVQVGVEDARFALATSADFNATDVTIPEGFTPEDLDSALLLVSQLSSRAQGGAPRLVVDRDVDLERHVVVVGRSQDRVLLDDVPYLESGRNVGVVVTRPSPFIDGRVFMAFTGSRPDDVRVAVEAGMSSRVNDVGDPYAVISIDDVSGFDDAAAADASRFNDSLAADATATDTPGPNDEEYEDWILKQAARVEAARAPETNQRRSVALILGLVAAMVASLWWLRRTRSNPDPAAAH